MRFQFESFPTEVFQSIRKKNKQNKFEIEKRNEIKRQLNSFKITSNDLLNYLGSLDYILSYLRYICAEPTQTIGLFIQTYIIHHQKMKNN